MTSHYSPPRSNIQESYHQPVPKVVVRPAVDPSVRALMQRDVEIVVQVEIDDTGRVTKASALSHDATLGGYLEKASISAAMRCRFEPAHMGDKAVASTHMLRFSFRKP